MCNVASCHVSCRALGPSLDMLLYIRRWNLRCTRRVYETVCQRFGYPWSWSSFPLLLLDRLCDPGPAKMIADVYFNVGIDNKRACKDDCGLVISTLKYTSAIMFRPNKTTCNLQLFYDLLFPSDVQVTYKVTFEWLHGWIPLPGLLSGHNPQSSLQALWSSFPFLLLDRLCGPWPPQWPPLQARPDDDNKTCHMIFTSMLVLGVILY